MAGIEKSELTDRPNKRRAGVAGGGLRVAESRPQVIGGMLRGARCTVCRHAVSQPDVPWCPACYSPVRPCGFTPAGTIWAATTIRLPVGRWTPPYGLAYVDVDDGPRVLVHVGVDPIPHAGDRIGFVCVDGDLVATGEVRR
ncbi:MAG: OB-fold domain-containing protein [Gordonia sp. (in: high G+C Gram-positive bacteria)]